MLGMKYISFFCLSFLLLLSSCSDSATNKNNRTSQEKQIYPRRLPNVPSSITKADDQALYMLKHYWDKFDFGDKELLRNREGFEECFANYFGLLSSLELPVVKDAVLYPLKNSLDSVLREELYLYRKYFYEAESPMNNNAIYELVLDWILSTPRTNEVQKEEARLLLDLITKNKVGTQATDFIYQKSDGSKHHLKNLLAPYSLLVFAKSDCTTCEAFIKQLRGNDELKAELEKLKLDIVIIYLDTELSPDKFDSLPEWVISGFDYEGVVLQKQLYDIKATPTFYLLKRGGEVLLKETFPDEVLEYLQRNI